LYAYMDACTYANEMLMRLDRFLDEMLAKCEINSEILSVE